MISAVCGVSFDDDHYLLKHLPRPRNHPQRFVSQGKRVYLIFILKELNAAEGSGLVSETKANLHATNLLAQIVHIT